MPFFLRLPVTSTEICPPCFKNKWNTRDSVNGTWPTICGMPPWSWTRLTATAWVLCGLSGLCCVKIHMYEINSFINTVTQNSQRTKGFFYHQRSVLYIWHYRSNKSYLSIQNFINNWIPDILIHMVASNTRSKGISCCFHWCIFYNYKIKWITSQ